MKETPKINRPGTQFHMVLQEPDEKEAIIKQYELTDIGAQNLTKNNEGWKMYGIDIEKWYELQSHKDGTYTTPKNQSLN